MTKYSKKFFRSMMILSIIIAVIALAVAVMAVVLKQYITAVAMLMVAGWQIVTYFKWKKNV